MLLGKRPRPPMKRTTSMTEITFDLGITNDHEAAAQPSDLHNPFIMDNRQRQPSIDHHHNNNQINQRFMAPATPALVSPRSSTTTQKNNNNIITNKITHRKNSADFVETSHFLRACSLCKRRLVPSRDIYMYRGDSAFCSLECRQQQMNQDERKEKFCLASKKEVHHHHVSTSANSVARSQVSTNAAAETTTVAAL